MTHKMVTINGQELIEGPIEGYKIFDANMKCRDMQYVVGMNEVPSDTKLTLC